MKFELKSIKHSEFASHETYCYQARLYVNGKPFAQVSNDGQGGADMIDYVKPFKDQDEFGAWRENINVIEAHLLDTEGETIESKCHQLLTDWLMVKDAKKILRKIAFIKMDGQVYSLKAKPTEVNRAQVKMQDWWDHSWILLNDLPTPRAVELILRSFDGEPHPMA